jgi:uncharacterized protein (DUF1778 family)
MYEVRTLLCMSELRSHRLNVRIASTDDALFRRAATAAHESLSEFVIESARERAERVLADRTRFVLSEEQWTAFQAALDRPAEPLPSVVELFQRPRPA